MSAPADLVRACFAAYETKDRAALENLLSDDFTFSSPLDDHISRARYFERCWPTSQHLSSFEIKNLQVEGSHVWVRYVARTTQGETFSNIEFFTVAGGKITQVQVFFGSDDPETAQESEICALMEEISAATRARDLPALLRHYAPDVIAFDVINPLRYQGTEAVGSRAAEWFASFEGPIHYHLSELRIVPANHVAFCHSLNQVRGVKTDGQPLEMWWRATVCWQKREGRWLITHLHSSVPFDMHTGQASLDLTPSSE